MKDIPIQPSDVMEFERWKLTVSTIVDEGVRKAQDFIVSHPQLKRATRLNKLSISLFSKKENVEYITQHLPAYENKITNNVPRTSKAEDNNIPNPCDPELAIDEMTVDV